MTYIINVEVHDHGQIETNVALEGCVGIEKLKRIEANNFFHEA